MTSAVNIALGNWVFPHLFQMCYSAQSATAIRRNAVWQPLYSLAYFFIILLGFAALLACSRPTTISTRRCCIRRHVLSGVGDRFAAGTGFLLALVPGSLLLLSAGTIFTRNIAQPICGPCRKRLPAPVARGAGVLCRAGGVPVHIRRQLPGAHPAQCLRGDRHAGAAGVLGIPVAARDGIRRAGRAGGGFRRLLAPFASSYWSRAVPEWEPGLIAMAINALVLIAVSLLTPMPRPSAVAIGIHSTSPRVRAGNQTT